MTNIIFFDPNKKLNKKTEENEPDRGRWTEHFDEEAARCFGTYVEWDDIAVMHLAEQIMNYMEAVDEYGAIYSMLALGIAITSYQKEDCEIPIREFFDGLKYLRSWNSSDENGKAGKVTKALNELCEILDKKYPDL